MNNSWRPDWQDEAAYPDPDDKSISYRQWAWEFLRRNEQYAQYFAAQRTEEDSVRAFERHNRLCQKYMVVEMTPPEAPPDKVRFRSDYTPDWHDSFEHEGPELKIESSNEIVIKFNFYWGLDHQVEWANRFLKNRLKVLTDGELIEAPPRSIKTVNYQKYLRLLDGRHDRATFRQLGEILCPRSGDKADAAKKLMKEAKELSGWKYRLLLQRGRI